MAVNIVGALKEIGLWIKDNPAVVLGLADQAKKLIPAKEDKIGVLSAAVLELEQKTNGEVGRIDEKVEVIQKQMHMMKIALAIMGSVLCVAIVAIILLAVL